VRCWPMRSRQGGVSPPTRPRTQSVSLRPSLTRHSTRRKLKVVLHDSRPWNPRTTRDVRGHLRVARTSRPGAIGRWPCSRACWVGRLSEGGSAITQSRRHRSQRSDAIVRSAHCRPSPSSDYGPLPLRGASRAHGTPPCEPFDICHPPDLGPLLHAQQMPSSRLDRQIEPGSGPGRMTPALRQVDQF